MLRDIRELTDDPEAYAAELRRRWGGLLSYRYIGRFHASMDNGDADETVTMRRDMRNPSGGLLLAVLGIASPDSGGVSDLEAVPNPVIWSCQVLDPGRDIKRFEVKTEVLKQGRQMAYSRSTIVDADKPSRVLALTEGQGVSIGVPPEGLTKMEHVPLEVVDSPDLPPLWQAFGGACRPAGTGCCRTLGRGGLARRRASHRAAVRHPRNRRIRRGVRCGRNRSTAGHVVARDVPGPREGRSVPGRGAATRRRADGTVAVRALLHDEGNGDGDHRRVRIGLLPR